MTTYEAIARQRELLDDSRALRMKVELEAARKLDRLQRSVSVVRARLGLPAPTV